MVHINKNNNSLEEFQLSSADISNLSVRQTECFMQYILFPTDHVCACAQVLLLLQLPQQTLKVGTLPHLEKIKFLYLIAPNWKFQMSTPYHIRQYRMAFYNQLLTHLTHTSSERGGVITPTGIYKYMLWFQYPLNNSWRGNDKGIHALSI